MHSQKFSSDGFELVRYDMIWMNENLFIFRNNLSFGNVLQHTQLGGWKTTRGMDFDPLNFDPLNFDPLNFDPLNFDPLNRL